MTWTDGAWTLDAAPIHPADANGVSGLVRVVGRAGRSRRIVTVISATSLASFDPDAFWSAGLPDEAHYPAR